MDAAKLVSKDVFFNTIGKLDVMGYCKRKHDEAAEKALAEVGE